MLSCHDALVLLHTPIESIDPTNFLFDGPSPQAEFRESRMEPNVAIGVARLLWQNRRDPQMKLSQRLALVLLVRKGEDLILQDKEELRPVLGGEQRSLDTLQFHEQALHHFAIT